MSIITINFRKSCFKTGVIGSKVLLTPLRRLLNRNNRGGKQKLVLIQLYTLKLSFKIYVIQ